MPENTIYFNGIVDERSLLLTQEQALQGNTTISIETQPEVSNACDFFSWVHEHAGDFLRLIRYLTKHDQELLLSYYFLGKTQQALGKLFRITQTQCSTNLRLAMKKLGMFILLGEPTAEVMARILTPAGLESSLPGAQLSEIIAAYAQCRSFPSVAHEFKLRRPDVRRAISCAAHRLLEDTGESEQALGAYIHGLVDQSSATGQGLRKSRIAKQGHIYKRDSNLLGKCRMDIKDQDIDQLFTSRANR